MLIDDVHWAVRSIVVATGRLKGKLVRLEPRAVNDVDGRSRRVGVNVTRERSQSAPARNPLALIDEIAEEQFRRHFGWPGQEL